MVRKKDNWKQKYKESIHDVNDNSNTAGKSDFSFIVAEDIGMNTIKANFFFRICCLNRFFTLSSPQSPTFAASQIPFPFA